MPFISLRVMRWSSPSRTRERFLDRPDSRLAQEAESVLTYSNPDFGLAPGTSSYVASVLALLVMGLQLSEAGRGASNDHSHEALETLQNVGDVLETTIETNTELVESMTSVLSEDTRLFFLGSGPNYGTALFSAAKMIESSRHNSVGQDPEKWAHGQYFCTGTGSVVVVLAPLGASVDRAREVLTAVSEVGGIAAVVCDAVLSRCRGYGLCRQDSATHTCGHWRARTVARWCGIDLGRSRASWWSTTMDS